LFAVFGVASVPLASGQAGQIAVQPTALYRFEVSYWDGGHLLTSNYQEGTANGYTFDPFNYPTFDGLGIYVPPSGYTPAPSTGLVALHRWTVIQGGWRTYFYYSTYYASHGSDYHYNGIAGWVFTPGRTSITNPAFVQPLPLHQLSVWYSQDLGFWNGYGTYPGNYVEPPPNRSGKNPYYDQGVIAALPPACVDPQFPQPPPPGGVGCVYAMPFNPPPPPPTCNASQSTKNKCAQLGGWWDDETCSCQY